MIEPQRDRLRSLPDFPAELPTFDPESAPADPQQLFVAWLDDALAHGVLQPHACTLSTAGPTGHVTARTLILKDLVDGLWVFAGARSTRKGVDLAANPSAALTFYWPTRGRQVRVTGEVEELPSEVEDHVAGFSAESFDLVGAIGRHVRIGLCSRNHMGQNHLRVRRQRQFQDHLHDLI